MNSPKISVIVPIFNAKEVLPRCIDSILSQTFTDFELLLIDDGSKDNSGKICDEYARKDNRIKVFHKENGGVSSARNLGLDNANGEWISFIDSDDYIDKRFFENFINNLVSDIIIQGYVEEKINDKPIYHNMKSLICENSYKPIFDELSSNQNTGYLWCRLFKNDIIINNNVRFNNKYYIQEDEEFIFHYMLYSKTASIIEGCYYHYFTPNFKSKYKIKNYINAINCNISIIKYRLLLQPELTSYEARHYVNRIVKYFILADYSTLFKHEETVKLFFSLLYQIENNEIKSSSNYTFLTKCFIFFFGKGFSKIKGLFLITLLKILIII